MRVTDDCRCQLDVVGFLPQLGHNEATLTAVGQKSQPVVDEDRAVRSGAQIPMITELGQFRLVFHCFHYRNRYVKSQNVCSLKF